MQKSLKTATASVVNDSKDEMLDQIQAAIDLVTAEAKKSKKAAEKQRALDAKKLLEAAVDIKTIRDKATALTADEALKLLQALDLSNKSVSSVEQGNRSKGYDGKTFTERRMEAQRELATKEQIIALLKEIKDNRDELQAEREQEARGLKEVFTDGLAGFLGPAGPLVTIWSELKRDYGDDAHKFITKFTSFLGIQKSIGKELNIEGAHNIRRQEKLFDSLGQQFKKLKDAVGGGSGDGKGLMDRILDHIGGGGGGRGGKGGGKIRGGGRGGMFTRAKRWLRKAPVIGKLMRGGIMGKAGAFLGRIAGPMAKGLAGLGRNVLKLVPGLGALLGAYGLATTESASATDTPLDVGLAYGEGALNGASIGALGGPIGAAIGAVVGVAITGIIRNWSTVKKSLAEGYDGFQSLMGKTWGATKEFFMDGVYYSEKLWDTFKTLASGTFDWLKDKIPGFGMAASLVGSVGSSVKQVASTVTDKVNALTKPSTVDYGPPTKPSGGNVEKFTQRAMGTPSPEVDSQIAAAAKATGVDRGALMATINQESSFRSTVNADDSSAQGLGQFTKDKWADMVKKYGKQYDIGLNDRGDGQKNAMMTALLMRDNKKALEAGGMDSGVASTYLMHLLGDTGGPRFLQTLQKDPYRQAASDFKAAAISNHDVFFKKDGTARTYAEIFQWAQAQVEQPAAAYDAKISPKVDEQKRVASETPTSNVNVAPSPATEPQSTVGGSRGGQGGRSVADIPTILGDNNMVVVNSGMFG